MQWVKANPNEGYGVKPKPGRAVIVELDKIRGFLKKDNNCWIGKAYDRNLDRLIDLRVRQL